MSDTIGTAQAIETGDVQSSQPDEEARQPQKVITLESLAELNRYDTIGRMLDTYRKVLDLDDYDSEHGNRFRDAAKIVRAICVMTGVPLKYEPKATA